MSILLNIKITGDTTSVEIKCNDFDYTRIFNMYSVDGEDRDGEGIQLDKDVEEPKARKLAEGIVKLVKEYNNEQKI